MRDLRKSIEEISGLRFIVEQLRLCSSPGRMLLLDTPWSSDLAIVTQRLERQGRYIRALADPSRQKVWAEIALQLEELHHLHTSIETCRTPQGCCSDIDLYELKMLALIERKVRALAEEHHLEIEPMPSLQAVLTLLDPRGDYLPSFYVSDDFSDDLKALRKQLEEPTLTNEERDELALQISQIEDVVRRVLTRALAPHAADMQQALTALATLDSEMAKARWAISVAAVCPTIQQDGETHLSMIVHPEVASHLAQRGEQYQPVSITFGASPTLITGANMAGKSVLLSSIALMQALTQFGFYIPAQAARIVLVDEIMMSIGDGQSISSGLSSFAAEMLRLNNIIAAMKGGSNILALIDEPARTTNPSEGAAIVAALVELFATHNTRAILTTHYSGIQTPCRRWRVRGFVESRLVRPLEVNKLAQCIDYTLEQEYDESVPHEALRIAEILGVDSELLSLCKQSFDLKKDEK